METTYSVQLDVGVEKRQLAGGRLSLASEWNNDTTFNLGNFYLSLLLFRATDFDGDPVIPLAYLLHECKLQSTQGSDVFFSHLESVAWKADDKRWSKVLVELNTHPNVIMVTDNELAITSAISTTLPLLKT